MITDRNSLFRDPTIRLCAFCCFGLFGAFFAWAALVELDEGVAANGQIVVENDRRVIQHLEGGIVETISVEEGQYVTEGQTLLVLTNTAGQAAQSELVYQSASLTASIVRKDAQLSNEKALDFSGLSIFNLPEDELQNIIGRERDLFQQETASLLAEVNVLRERERSSAESTHTIQAQRQSAQTALVALSDQLKRKKELAEMQFARLDEVRTLERDVASMESEIARLKNQLDTASSAAIDFRNQIQQVNANYRSRISEARLEAKRELQIFEERLVAAKDVVDRNVISAPQSGKILNLSAKTIGGVIRAGDPIMEIVPVSKTIIAAVKINPADRASVMEGLVVRAQITAFDNRDVPELSGEIIDISGDLLIDPQSQASYYEARIKLTGYANEDFVISPGLPVSAFIFSGAKRTTLEHLFDPMSESMFAGLRGR